MLEPALLNVKMWRHINCLGPVPNAAIEGYQPRTEVVDAEIATLPQDYQHLMVNRSVNFNGSSNQCMHTISKKQWTCFKNQIKNSNGLNTFDNDRTMITLQNLCGFNSLATGFKYTLFLEPGWYTLPH